MSAFPQSAATSPTPTLSTTSSVLRAKSCTDTLLATTACRTPSSTVSSGHLHSSLVLTSGYRVLPHLFERLQLPGSRPATLSQKVTATVTL
ncbi:hypothetical protein VTN00DRAFT_4419 [Thermoascus crustaceus]|uniref:uncharacterized protein n=1 Tax=Thermoascus crustaceus TaxID=5088 RepID=UPI0037422854